MVWGDIKKSIKSSIAAAVALWFAWNRGWSTIKIVANDLKQADSRVAYYIRRSLELNPEMRAQVDILNYLVKLPNNTKIEAVPIDPHGEAGGNDTLIVFSELWGATSKAALKMWTEMTLSPMLYGQSMRWIETYAGYEGEAVILEQLYRQGVKEGRLVEGADQFDPPLALYENQSLLALWNDTPRLPWQSEEYYREESAILSPAEFNRVHRNQWASSLDSFIPIEWWDSSKREIHPMYQDQPCILAADAAISGDCFGLILISAATAPTGLYSQLEVIPDHYAIRYVGKWTPPHGGRIEFAAVEAEIRRLSACYNVIELTYDPYQLEDMMQRLKREMVTHIHPFNQGKDRAVADKALKDAIRDQKVYHGGEADLREHLQNANAKAEDKELRIVKRSDNLKIDLAVSLSMALARAVHWRLAA